MTGDTLSTGGSGAHGDLPDPFADGFGGGVGFSGTDLSTRPGLVRL